MKPSKPKPLVFILLISVVWIVACVALQDSIWLALGILLAISAGVALFRFYRRGKFSIRLSLPTAIAILSSVILICVAGITTELTSLNVRISAELGIGLIAGGFLRRYIRWATAKILLVLLPWLIYSLDPVIFERKPIKLDPQRFSKLHSRARYPNRKIGLALSGGGYRATLMHAGVLSALEDLNLGPTHVSSASGGSIAAAFYVAGGAPQDLLAAIMKQRLSLRRELSLIQNLVRLPFPARLPGTKIKLLPGYSFSRLDVQEELLDRVLLSGLKLSQLTGQNVPKLLLCTTDILSGKAVGFTPKGFVVSGHKLAAADPFTPLRPKIKMDLAMAIPSRIFADTKPADIPVSSYVAASGAFPLAFPAKTFTFKLPEDSDNLEYFDDSYEFRLVDGGVADNTGVTLAMELDYLATYMHGSNDDDSEPLVPRQILEIADEWEQDIIISSDASALIPTTQPSDVSNLSRVIDVIYSRVSIRPPEAYQSALAIAPPPEVISVNPRVLLPASVGPIAGVLCRTDDEVRSLIMAELGLSKNEVEYVRNGPCNKPGQADTLLAARLAKQLNEDEREFTNASTLQDHMSGHEAEAIYRFGRLLLLLEADYIIARLAYRDRLANKQEPDAILLQLKAIAQVTCQEIRTRQFVLKHQADPRLGSKLESGGFGEDLMERIQGECATLAP